MKLKLTERQADFLAKIITMSKDKGYPPTYRELAAEFSMSIKSIADYIEVLEKKGYIERQPYKSRTLKVL